MSSTPLHPCIASAAEGTLPDWAVASAGRREHMERVATLLDAWATALGRSEQERVRWRALGFLHDALRDERSELLRPHVPEALRGLPGPLLHGPAAAERLRAAGVEDEELLAAVAYHTIGDPEFGTLGCALYAADFLEPGRGFLEAWRAGLRARMPHDLEAVVLEIAQARIDHLAERGSGVLPRTLAFRDALAQREARAEER